MDFSAANTALWNPVIQIGTIALLILLANVLIRKIPIFGNIMYSSRGPICDIHDIQVMKQLTDGIKELAQKHNKISREQILFIRE